MKDNENDPSELPGNKLGIPGDMGKKWGGCAKILPFIPSSSFREKEENIESPTTLLLADCDCSLDCVNDQLDQEILPTD